jgi:solute carrier family 8 (sodium/calcium exchanger)
MVLMVIATVAPEIVLTTMEIIEDNFQAGEIGPSAIVGSAAWNYLITVGLCVGAVRSPSTRRIENTAAFWTTLAYSAIFSKFIVAIGFYRQIL